MPKNALSPISVDVRLKKRRCLTLYFLNLAISFLSILRF